ncbi:MAG: hypothetical protein HFJ24_04790 [Clostridia bacterium]|nr:hypothetical protein [Clostridia bacterium]MCI9275289.1 hypothetical protein [Clostridia bacterium]
MNIAVINIRDIIKWAIILAFIIIIIVSGIILVKGKDKLKDVDEASAEEDSSFLYYIDTEIPLISEKEEKPKKPRKEVSSRSKILDTQLAMLYNLDEDKENEEVLLGQNDGELDENQEEAEPENKRVEGTEAVETKVITEKNIEASFTDEQNNIQVKNQSKYDVKDLITNSNYEIKNKNKVIIYHTHTCESYTSSDKYSYEMTGAYRTTDLSYTVAKVRR